MNLLPYVSKTNVWITYMFVAACCLAAAAWAALAAGAQASGPLGPSDRPEAYFNGSSFIRINRPISLKQLVGLSFRTCVGEAKFSFASFVPYWYLSNLWYLFTDRWPSTISYVFRRRSFRLTANKLVMWEGHLHCARQWDTTFFSVNCGGGVKNLNALLQNSAHCISW